MSLYPDSSSTRPLKPPSTSSSNPPRFKKTEMDREITVGHNLKAVVSVLGTREGDYPLQTTGGLLPPPAIHTPNRYSSHRPTPIIIPPISPAPIDLVST
ncbi:hypothetical protein IAR50_006626 [Cryptococcus sp. DSM 104548]